MKKILLSVFIAALIFAGMAIYASRPVKHIGVISKKLSYSELTPEEQENSKMLFDGDYYVEVVTVGDKKCHAVVTAGNIKNIADSVGLSGSGGKHPFLMVR